MQPARSLVMAPLSTVWTHTFSRVCANLWAAGQGEAPASRAGPEPALDRLRPPPSPLT